MSNNPAKYVVLLNGPPGSGKDFAAAAIVPFLKSTYPWLSPKHMKLSTPLKEAVHKLLCVPYTPEHYEGPSKDEPSRLFYGMTPREAYISMSEEYAKNKFGDDFFGRLAIRAMQFTPNANCFVISDAGFLDEVMPIIDFVGVKNVLIIQIYATKNGKRLTYKGDSRGYIAEQVKAQLVKEGRRERADKLAAIDLPNDFDDTFKMLVQAAAKKFFDKR